MEADEHYLKRELYELIQWDSTIFEFIQLGSLDGIWYWDLENPDHEWLSPRFWETLGFNPVGKQHLVTEWQDLILAEDLPMVLDNFERHCADPNHHYDQIVRYRHKDGSTVWVRCRGIAIRDESGTAIRLLGAHTDLTPLKRAEQALLERTTELEIANARLQSALNRVRSLEELLPICMYCKNIRDEDDDWHSIEQYVAQRTGARFSHGMCPRCYEVRHQQQA